MTQVPLRALEAAEQLRGNGVFQVTKVTLYRTAVSSVPITFCGNMQRDVALSDTSAKGYVSEVCARNLGAASMIEEKGNFAVSETIREFRSDRTSVYHLAVHNSEATAKKKKLKKILEDGKDAKDQ